MLDDLGLVSALRWLAEQTEARADLVIAFHATPLPARLTPEIETACFRIVQEALTNIVRHAKAQQVKIDLFNDGETLRLSVRDDGCGFATDMASQRALAGDSMGVLGMHERAAFIGGQLGIQSSPGKGTHVSLNCKLRMREPAA
jgi:signal transduction histidine kinase